MSTRDARLSPQERAALANLEAAAVADDPQFAARLRGSPMFRVRASAPRLLAFTVGQWRAALHHAWWGCPLTVVGFVLMVLGLSVGMALGLVGALVATAGLRLNAQMLYDALQARRQTPPG